LCTRLILISRFASSSRRVFQWRQTTSHTTENHQHRVSRIHDIATNTEREGLEEEEKDGEAGDEREEGGVSDDIQLS